MRIIPPPCPPEAELQSTATDSTDKTHCTTTLSYGPSTLHGRWPRSRGTWIATMYRQCLVPNATFLGTRGIPDSALRLFRPASAFLDCPFGGFGIVNALALSSLGILRLTRWSSQIHAGFHGPGVTWEHRTKAEYVSSTGPLPSVARRSRTLPLRISLLTS
jgi:hypothetical protein